LNWLPLSVAGRGFCKFIFAVFFFFWLIFCSLVVLQSRVGLASNHTNISLRRRCSFFSSVVVNPFPAQGLFWLALDLGRVPTGRPGREIGVFCPFPPPTPHSRPPFPNRGRALGVSSSEDIVAVPPHVRLFPSQPHFQFPLPIYSVVWSFYSLVIFSSKAQPLFPPPPPVPPVFAPPFKISVRSLRSTGSSTGVDVTNLDCLPA